MNFRTGTFNRSRVPLWLRGFCPARAVAKLADIDSKGLSSQGKRLLLLDVDNTLLPWRSEDIPQSTIDWIASARGAGLDLCILSNTRHPERLGRIAARLGVEFLLGRFKPSRRMYLEALRKFGRKPEEAIMVGDQLVTDVLGANRSGIDAIWVKPMTGRDFIGTKVSRLFEKLIRPTLNRRLLREDKL